MEIYFRHKLKEFEIYETTINLICKKFKNAISYFDVINWLNNFEPDHYETFLNVLKHILFFDDLDIIESLDQGFRSIIEKVNQQSDIYIMSIGKYGKSGSAMVYFLNKTDAFRGKRRIKSASESSVLNHNFFEVTYSEELVKQVNQSENKHKVVIMIDDFFGTGDSVKDFYFGLENGQRKESLIDFNQEFQKGSAYPEIIFLSVAAMSNAIKNIESNIPGSRVQSRYILNKAFEVNDSPFGYRNKMVPIRNLCYSYGENLYKNGPLGYKNSQSLIVFSYGAPNNTLPIIWSDKNNWYPIFPRFYKHKMQKAKEFRKNTAFHLSVAQTLGVKNIDKLVSGRGETTWKRYNFVTKTDFLLYGLLRLKRKKRSKVIICQSLGIPSDEYDLIIRDAVEKGIIDENEDLTEAGNMLYFEIVKAVEKITKTSELGQKEPIVYVPNSFEGNT